MGWRPTDWKIVAPRGKPLSVTSPPGAPALRISVSHTRGFVACALASGAQIGADVERIENAADAEEAILEIVSPAEREALDGLSHEARVEGLCRIWSLKESYVKAIGLGLGGLERVTILRGLSFDLESDPPQAGFHSTLPGHTEAWTFRSLRPRVDVAAALAVRTAGTQTVAVITHAAPLTKS